MVALCREFSIPRKTGYKIFDRYEEYGLEALTDRSRRPWRYGSQLPQQVESASGFLLQEPHSALGLIGPYQFFFHFSPRWLALLSSTTLSDVRQCIEPGSDRR